MGATDALRRAADAARREDPAVTTIKKIIVALGSPWLHGELYEVSKRYDKPTKRTAKQVIADVEDARDAHAAALVKASSSLKLSCVSARTVRLLENGYAVPAAVPGTLTSIRATTFAHYISTEDRRELEEGIRRSMPGAEIELRSIVGDVVTDVCQPDDLTDALILSVSGSVTEAVVIDDDLVEAVATIPIGYEEIVAEAKRSLPVAGDPLGFLTKYAVGELSAREADRVSRVVDRVATEWSRTLAATLKEVGVRAVPATIVLLSSPGPAALIRAMLERPTVTAEIFTGTKPVIKPFPHVRLLTDAVPDVF